MRCDDLVAWLLHVGFVRDKVGGGHLQFKNGEVRVAVRGHGPKEVFRHELSAVLRKLVASGFERDVVVDLRDPKPRSARSSPA